MRRRIDELATLLVSDNLALFMFQIKNKVCLFVLSVYFVILSLRSNPSTDFQGTVKPRNNGFEGT